jgi:branched-chain amino acid aminotransferase
MADNEAARAPLHDATARSGSREPGARVRLRGRRSSRWRAIGQHCGKLRRQGVGETVVAGAMVLATFAETKAARAPEAIGTALTRYHSAFQRSRTMAEHKYPEWVWHNGEIVPWREATVHVMSHSLQYGSAIFEGIRCYRTPVGGAIFRLDAHIKRLFNSARIYDMVLPFSIEETADACHEVLKRNGFDQAYLRPCAFRGLGGFGISADTPVQMTIAGWPMGPYLGAEALKQGITACVSSWQRFAPNTIPAGAKAAGNYLSGQLIAREARQRGFGEGIALASTGLLSEGAGENVFLVMDGALHTAPVSAALLNGITRDSIITLARDNGIAVVERDLPREYLYLADEVFMCGTAAEVTPIRAVDGKQVGAGEAGPVTRRIQDLFFGLFDGRTEDKWGWLEAL